MFKSRLGTLLCWLVWIATAGENIGQIITVAKADSSSVEELTQRLGLKRHGKVHHRDLLELYHKVLSELLKRDHLKQKLDQVVSRLDHMNELFVRVEELEHRIQSPVDALGLGFGNNMIPAEEKSGELPVNDPVSSSAIPENKDTDSSKGKDRISKLDRRDVAQTDQASRHEPFLHVVAATLQEHSQQIAELEKCNAMHGELVDDHSNQLEVLNTQLGIHKAKIDKFKVDGQWHQFKIESLENSTRTLRTKVYSISTAMDGIYNDHGNIYRRIDLLEGVNNSAQCGNLCLELSPRLALLERRLPREDQGKASGPQAGERRIESAAFSRTQYGVSHHTYNALVAMNETLRDILQNYETLKQSVEAASHDAASNKGDINNLLQQLDLIYDQVDKLRESDEKGLKQHRRLQKRLKELEEEMEGSAEASLVSNTSNLPKPLAPVRPPRNTSAAPVREVLEHEPSFNIIIPTVKEYNNKILVSPQATSKGSGVKREIGKYYITPPPKPAPTESSATAESEETRKVHAFLSQETLASGHREVLIKGQDVEGGRYMTAVVTDLETNGKVLDPRVRIHAYHTCKVKSIGDPQIVHEVPKTVSGWWRRDTWDGNRDSIYVFNDTYKARHLYEYKTIEALKSNTPSVVHRLSFACSGSGHVVYRRNLFCNRFGTNRIVKYDLLSRETKSRRLVDAGYRNLYPYSFGGFSDIDIAVDEGGMWVVYGSLRHEGNITIARFNPDTLKEEAKWHTPFQKNSTGNTFVVCGRLYVVDYHNDSASVVGVFDTETGSTFWEEDEVATGRLQLGGEQGAYRTMLDYSPRDSTLYAWHMSRDWNGQLVTYAVTKSRGHQ